jgi:hypothetical protein
MYLRASEIKHSSEFPVADNIADKPVNILPALIL